MQLEKHIVYYPTKSVKVKRCHGIKIEMILIK